MTAQNEELVRYEQRRLKDASQHPAKREAKSPSESPSRDVGENKSYGKRRVSEPTLQKKKPKYKMGGVHISCLKEAFTREYDHRWTAELFTVTRVYMRDPKTPIYKLKDWAGERIEGTFYEAELSTAVEPEGGIYKIEKVLSTRKRGRHRETLVKWLL